jgi:hypothetical protein
MMKNGFAEANAARRGEHADFVDIRPSARALVGPAVPAVLYCSARGDASQSHVVDLADLHSHGFSAVGAVSGFGGYSGRDRGFEVLPHDVSAMLPQASSMRTPGVSSHSSHLIASSGSNRSSQDSMASTQRGQHPPDFHLHNANHMSYYSGSSPHSIGESNFTLSTFQCPADLSPSKPSTLSLIFKR